MALRPASVQTSSPICSSSTGRSPEGVEIFVPLSRQWRIDLKIVCAGAEFLLNARKGMLAVLTPITLYSCRCVRICCIFFMECSQRENRKLSTVVDFRINWTLTQYRSCNSHVTDIGFSDAQPPPHTKQTEGQ